MRTIKSANYKKAQVENTQLVSLNDQQLQQEIKNLESQIRLFDQYGLNRYDSEETENDPLTEQLYESQKQLSLLRDELRRRKSMGDISPQNNIPF